MTKDELLKLVTVLQAELEATNRQVEILSDALAESRREVAALKDVQEPVAQCTVDVSGAAGPSCEPLNWHKTAAQPATEVLRLSKDGIWANPDIPADDAAKLVLEAIDHNIKILVQKAVLAEREACAKFFEGKVGQADLRDIAAFIRARGNT